MYEELKPMVEGSKSYREQLRKGLARKQIDLKQSLSDIENALKFLDSHPEFEEFHNLLGRSGF